MAFLTRAGNESWEREIQNSKFAVINGMGRGFDKIVGIMRIMVFPIQTVTTRDP